MTETIFHYGHRELRLRLPDNCPVYQSTYGKADKTPEEMLVNSIRKPVSGKPLRELLEREKPGKTVIVVSDITRPIPYTAFLPRLLNELEQSVHRKDLFLLIATGMHRASTQEERLRMFGKHVVDNYPIIDHNCEQDDSLREVDGHSLSGAKVKLNRHYLQATFRIVTSLVEPHFMAGFSGGRKSLCPGLSGLDTIRQFHGYRLLSHPRASTAVLEGNPCHEEAASIAALCPPDFSINIVLDRQKQVNAILSGELFTSHRAAVACVTKACCPEIVQTSDVALTSSGGYPLDATFYQCVKGFVNCLPAIKTGGEIIAFGACREGIGSPEYAALMKKYAGNLTRFLRDIQTGKTFTKDQWQLQMHLRALIKTGTGHLHFYTSGIREGDASCLSVCPHCFPEEKIEKAIQQHINRCVRHGKRIAVFPEGPYCSPIENTQAFF